MTLVQFDGRIREDRLIGFYVPTNILPGQKCSFQTTISQPAPPNGSPSTVYKIFTFTKIVPAVCGSRPKAAASTCTSTAASPR